MVVMAHTATRPTFDPRHGDSVLQRLPPALVANHATSL